MKYPKHLEYATRFARFCLDTGLAPADAADLLVLADRAFKAGERECNVPNTSADRQRKAFEERANVYGLRVQWPGLWPSVVKRGRTVYLPVWA